MTISRVQKGYRETDLKIAIALGAGQSAEDAAAFAECARSTVFERKKANGEWMDLVASLVKGATAASKAAYASKLQAQYERMYGKAIQVVEDTLGEDDPRLRFDAAKRVIDEVKGKPTQRIETTIEKTETKRIEVVQIPNAELQWLLQNLSGTRHLLSGGAPEPIIDTVEREPGVFEASPQSQSAEGSEGPEHSGS